MKSFFSIFRKMSQKCEQFSYEGFFIIFFLDFGGYLVLNGPPPSPSPASMSKFPSRGKNMKKTWFLVFFMIPMENMKNRTKMMHKGGLRLITLTNNEDSECMPADTKKGATALASSGKPKCHQVGGF